jgi:hypothetical protein
MINVTRGTLTACTFLYRLLFLLFLCVHILLFIVQYDAQHSLHPRANHTGTIRMLLKDGLVRTGIPIPKPSYRNNLSVLPGSALFYASDSLSTASGATVPGCKSRGPGFHSRPHQIFWEVAALERGPLSLVRITEELLERKSNGSGLENREYRGWSPPRWLATPLYWQKLALTLADQWRWLSRNSSLVD